MFNLLEKTAQWTHKWFAAIASLIVLSAVALLASDFRGPWIAVGLSAKMVKTLGKSFGSIAAVLTIAAMLYYVFREVFIRTRRLNFKLPAWFDSFLKYWIAILRLTHPFIGILVFVAALMHGYILWILWSGGTKFIAIWTGLGAQAVLLVALISGLLIRQMPKMFFWRYAHRVVGILFLLSYFVHKATE